MDAPPTSRTSESSDHGASERRDILAEWYDVPSDTFEGMSDAALDEILDAIRDTPSRWTGIPRSGGHGR